MTTYDFRPNYNLAPIGDFVTASQKLVFPSSGPVVWHWNGDTGSNHYFSIVVGPDGQHWMQMIYPKGNVGASGSNPGYANSTFQVYASPAAELVVEYDWMFVTGFDYHSQGKIGPSVENGPTLTWNTPGIQRMGLRTMWNSHLPTSDPNYGSQTKSHGRFYLADNTTGAHLGGETYTPWDFVDGVIYNSRFRYAPGPSGSVEILIKKSTESSYVSYFKLAAVPNTNASVGFVVSVNTFFGGQGALIAAQRDCFSKSRVTRIYTGPPSDVTPPGPTVHSAKITLT